MRGIAGEITFLLGYFWLVGAWRVVAFVICGIMFATAITRMCPCYNLRKISTVKKSPNWLVTLLVIILLVLPIIGAIWSAALT